MLSLSKLTKRFGQYKVVPSRLDEVRFCCPYCVDIGKPPDRKFHLYINLTKGVGYCFRCGKVLKLHHNDLKTKNFYFQNVNIVDKSYLAEIPKNISIFDSEEGVKFLRHKLSNYQEEYVNRFLEEMDIRYCIDSYYPHLFGRIMVPIRFEGEIVGFQFRSIYGEEPKYFTYGYRQYKVKDFVFNYDLACKSDYVYICEGIFDILPFYDKAISCFGKMLTDNQIRLIANTWSKIIICFDKDAILDSLVLGINLLKYGFEEVKIVDLSNANGKDPCEIGFEIVDYPLIDLLEMETL